MTKSTSEAEVERCAAAAADDDDDDDAVGKLTTEIYGVSPEVNVKMTKSISRANQS